MPRIAIFGAGGFGREVVTAARSSPREIVLMADEPAPDFAGIRVLAPSELRPDDRMVIAIADPEVRRRIAGRFQNFATLFAPTAVIGPETEIGEGSVFCDFSMVTASAKIGRHFHCNIHSYVAHDCVIGDFVTFGPNVACNGNVTIGDGAYLGSGANLRNGVPGRPLTIGAGAFIGMGAVVTRDVPAGVMVLGNPARIVRAALRAAS